jgi:hypothetical protein
VRKGQNARKKSPFDGKSSEKCTLYSKNNKDKVLALAKNVLLAGNTGTKWKRSQHTCT